MIYGWEHTGGGGNVYWIVPSPKYPKEPMSKVSWVSTDCFSYWYYKFKYLTIGEIHLCHIRNPVGIAAVESICTGKYISLTYNNHFLGPDPEALGHVLPLSSVLPTFIFVQEVGLKTTRNTT